MESLRQIQFEITPDSYVFTHVYSHQKKTIERLPVAVWVEWPPIKEFGRVITGCSCDSGFKTVLTEENRALFRSAGMEPGFRDGATICFCYGKPIE